MLEPSVAESDRKDAVLRSVLSAIRENRVIKLPDFAGEVPMGTGPYTGTFGPYRYQFEGEEDLLHFFVVREDGKALTVEEAQQVTSFLYAPVPKALIWLKPGTYSQHFYIGHDELLTYLVDK